MVRLVIAAAILSSCAKTQPPEPTPTPNAPVETALIALTATEYNNTIRDLLALPNEGDAWPDPPEIAASFEADTGDTLGLFGTQPSQAPPWPFVFPEEPGQHGFEGMADGQSPTPFGVEQLQKAASRYGPYVLVSPVFFTCEDFEALAGDAQRGCARDSVERLAQRAWRRPLTTDETTRLDTFFDAVWSAGPAHEAVVLAAIGVLQAPAFVYRVEHGVEAQRTGDVVPLSGWEMASRLSYFLWDSMPDPQLFGAAASGALDTPDGVAAQARRMLEDPRARAAVVHFHHQWLETDEVLRIAPARRAYGPLYGLTPAPALDTTDDGAWPSVLGPIRHSLYAEVGLFVEHTVFSGEGTLTALLTSSRGHLSSHTRDLYGESTVDVDGPLVTVRYGTVAAVGQSGTVTLSPVELPPTERAGLLTLPATLAVGAHPVHPAPILRGKRVLERVACLSFGAPPPGAEATAPPDSETAEATNRQRTEAVTAELPCSGCHDALNPPGFAFEHYDSMGRRRELDNGQPIDASGTLPLGAETLTFTDAVDLAHQLAGSRTVSDCYVLHWTRYATGVDLSAGEAGLAALQEDFAAHDDVRELLVAIVTSDLFRHRRLANGEG